MKMSLKMPSFPPRYGPAQGSILSIVDACKLPLSKVGVHDQPPLGCGAYGCVYPTASGRAVKVADDRSESEASGALWLMALGARRPAELPRIFGVYKLQRCVPRGVSTASYVIVREDIGDTGIEKTDAIYDALYRIESAGQNTTNDCNFVADLVRSVARQLAQKFSSRDVRHLLMSAAKLQVWACRNDARIYDTHLLNWGRRENGEFVLRDFGKILATEEDRGPAAPAYATEKLPAFGGLRGW